MSDSIRSTQIFEVGTVFAPVADQDRALEFYLMKLGFEKRFDMIYSDGIRWIEVAPHGSMNRIALVPAQEGKATGSDQTICALSSKDIKADHADLLARGVDVDAQIGQNGTSRAGLVSSSVTVTDPVPPQFFFRDLDGNRFLVVQAG